MLEFRQVHKAYATPQGPLEVLAGVDLALAPGESLALMGESGSGKSTLLHLAAGLDLADAGEVRLGSRNLATLAEPDRARLRREAVGLIFQQFHLVPSLTVLDNLRLQARLAGVEDPAWSAELIRRLGLAGRERRYPEQLSGGQQQRVSLARALALRPDVLLLDEPFGALDAKVRQELRRWLRHLHDELGFTSLFVTHDQEEALELSDRVAVMSNGRIEQIDTPDAVYRSPANRFVFEFLGDVNHLEGEVRGGTLTCGEARLSVALPDGPEELLLRPHEVRLAEAPTPEAHLPVTVTAISPVGAEVRVELAADWLGEPWLATVRHADYERLGLSRGQRLYAIPRRWHRFPDASRREALTRLASAA